MPDKNGWYGPEDGWINAHCNQCGADFECCVTAGGGPIYHPCPPIWVDHPWKINENNACLLLEFSYPGWVSRTSYNVSVDNERK